ncbi:MAG: response regulator [Arenicella sp.]
MKVLLVEDDFIIADAIMKSTAKAGLQLEWVNSIKAAKAAVDIDKQLTLLILDLGLPDGDGLNFLRSIRSDGAVMPVLILTARDEPRARVLGLDSGADDYLIKPFDMNELVARVRALQRRSMGRAAALIEYERLSLDPGQMQVYLDNQLVTLPLSQFKLLQYLLESTGRVKTKQQIIDALYKWDESVEENTIEVYVSQLRKQLWPTLIKTMRGIGYLIPRVENSR